MLDAYTKKIQYAPFVYYNLNLSFLRKRFGHTNAFGSCTVDLFTLNVKNDGIVLVSKIVHEMT